MSKKITRENIVWFVSLHFWLKMDSERISRDFWRHSDSTGTHIRRTVGRALRDARAIAAGGGPDLSRAKRPEPRVSRLSSSCSRAIREVPSLRVARRCSGRVHVSSTFCQTSTVRRRAYRSRDEPPTHRASSATRGRSHESLSQRPCRTGTPARPPEMRCARRRPRVVHTSSFFFHAPG